MCFAFLKKSNIFLCFASISDTKLAFSRIVLKINSSVNEFPIFQRTIADWLEQGSMQLQRSRHNRDAINIKEAALTEKPTPARTPTTAVTPKNTINSRVASIIGMPSTPGKPHQQKQQ